MFKRVIISLTLSISILVNLLAVPAFAVADSDEYSQSAVTTITQKTDMSNLKAKSAILIDASTGNILLEKDSHEKRPIASVTKIMSMLLVMEAVDSGKLSLDDKVPVSDHSYSMGGSQVWLKPGEVFTVDEMMKAVAIHSANDATVALAEKIAGSEDAFVALMNDKAKELGMNDTNFLDCTGLTDDGHYSSAYDIAVMSRELINKHPKILDYTTKWLDSFRPGDHQVTLNNTNKLIKFYQGANGLKTGFTTKAGYNLSAAAKRNNLQLIGVVLGEPDSNTRFAEAQKLLDYGFINFQVTKAGSKGDEIADVSIKKGVKVKVKGILGDDVNLVLNKGQKGKITNDTVLEQNITAPVKEGQKLGEVVYKIGDNEVGRADIVAQSAVQKASFIRLFFRMVLQWFGIGKG